MRLRRAGSRGWTLTEFVVAMAIFAVVMLVGMTSWEMTWDAIRNENDATLDYQTAFGALETMAEQVERSNTIQIPDPDNKNVPSMQLLVKPVWNSSLGNSAYGGSVRRAYRLSGNKLIMEWKDEGDTVSSVYSGITSLTFTMLDAPNNTEVQIALTCTQGGRVVNMQTTAWKRN